ncbi:hypothetical protein DI53_3488 [Sphingobacterium deserti]|uniref:Uncharacterized protein n=2 Tax=Sphingobacterium deserti TaxID=1229276 RepID=A0A0B8T5C1_9SPHI|nr:hypothetical protein DI53_3488 [Sphingobacterium deserti]
MVVIVFLFFTNCKKDMNDPSSGSGSAQVFVMLTDVERDIDNNSDPAVIRSQANNLRSANRENIGHRTSFTLPFSDDITVFGTLEEAAGDVSQPNSNPTNLKRSSVGVAAIERNPLPAGTRYLIAVYNESGEFLAQNTYISGRESETAAFVLDGGSTYTFVGLSFNTQNSSPTIVYTNSANRTLNTGSVTATAQDLMVFKRSLTVQSGDNTLAVVLRHIFTEITTSLVVDPSIGGTITSINSADISPIRTSATYSLGTETITYAPLSPNSSRTVTFPAITPGGTERLTSTPTLLVAPSTPNGTLTLRNLTINGTSRSEFLVPNLNIEPGKKYNLNLNFGVPCTQNVNNTAFDVRNGNSADFIAQSADYGYVLDIYRLDNSFNMIVNGTPIASNEIQFQSGVSGFPRNIQFADGALWGVSGVPEIFNLQGNAASPIIRVTVSSTGQVSLEGRKESNGVSFPLVPVSGGNLTFNTVPWNTTGSNNIRITQATTGLTLSTGNARGKQIITCPN